MTDRTKAPGISPLGHMDMPVPDQWTLPNGVTVHSLRAAAADTPYFGIHALMRIPVASADEVPAAGLLAQSITEGTATMTTAEMTGTLDLAGAKITCSHATGWLNWECTGLSGAAPTAVAVLRDLIGSPRYDAAAWEQRRGVAAASLRTMHCSVPALTQWEANAHWWGEDHPNGFIVLPEDLDGLHPEHTYSLYRNRYSPDRLHVFIYGNVTPELETLVSQVMGTLPPGSDTPLPTKAAPVLQAAEPGMFAVNLPESLQATVRVTMPGLMRTDDRFESLRLAVTALGGYFGSRLMQNLREDKGVTYGISSALAASPEGAYIAIVTHCQVKSAVLVMQEIQAEIERLKTDPPAGDELERLRQYALSDLIKRLDSPEAITGYHTQQLTVGTPPDYFARLRRAIDTMTPDSLAEAAHLIDHEAAVIVVGGPLDQVRGNRHG